MIRREIEIVELIGAERHAIMHARRRHPRGRGVPLPDGIYNVFAIAAGRVRRIDDYANRAEALAAAA